ncbi:hypothetical protein [Yersinia enterocolitica]|uniref:hypothetical protein n=1 Tax=Yersinia enterocolitica TaxID=630 RepID=UPI003D7BEEE2
MVKHDGEWLQRLHKASLRDGQQCEVYSTDLRHVIKSHSALVAQLEALKRQEPVAWMHYSQNGIRNFNTNRPRPRKGNSDAAPLFTAAKPKALPRHIYSMLVNELRDVPAIGCKRQLIIGVLNRHGVIAEPVQCDPPAAK